MIYTSCFNNRKKFPVGLTVLSIARYAPNYLKIDSVPCLAPSSELLKKWKKNRISKEDYKSEYFAELLNNIKNVKRTLTNLNAKNNCMFLCYEKPGDFCHRHLLQEFCDLHINKNGVRVEFEEFGFSNEKRQIKIM